MNFLKLDQWNEQEKMKHTKTLNEIEKSKHDK